MGKSKTKYYRYQLASLLISACFTQTVTADFIGVYAGAGSWNHTAKGQINHLGTNTDLEKDFGYEDEFSNFVYIAVEHPFPLIPNIRVSRYGLGTKGTKTVTASSEFTFAGTAYTNGTNVSTELRWDEEDALLYYEFLDNIISFDLGLGVKKVDGEISVTSSGVSNTLRIEETLPIAYAMAAVMIPGTGITISIDTTQTFAGDNDIVQTNTKVSYETSYLVGIEAGYRTSTMKLNNIDTIDGEMEFTGPFANLLVHF